MRHQEWHITVTGDPFQWRGWCVQNGIKPLWIELNNFDRQLMCAITGANMKEACIDQALIDAGDVTPYTRDMERAGFHIVRVKHEVESTPLDITTHGDKETVLLWPEVPGALYYECHLKFDGRFQPQFAKASRDLYREGRWYVTKRQSTPFDPNDFAARIHRANGERSHFDAFEYEACLVDTNPGLDARWN